MALGSRFNFVIRRIMFRILNEICMCELSMHGSHRHLEEVVLSFAGCRKHEVHPE